MYYLVLWFITTCFSIIVIAVVTTLECYHDFNSFLHSHNKRITWKRCWFVPFIVALRSCLVPTDRPIKIYLHTHAYSNRSNNGCGFHYIIDELFQFQHINLWRLLGTLACLLHVSDLLDIIRKFAHFLRLITSTIYECNTCIASWKLKWLCTRLPHTDTRSAFTDNLFLFKWTSFVYRLFRYFIVFIFSELQWACISIWARFGVEAMRLCSEYFYQFFRIFVLHSLCPKRRSLSDQTILLHIQILFELRGIHSSAHAHTLMCAMKSNFCKTNQINTLWCGWLKVKLFWLYEWCWTHANLCTSNRLKFTHLRIDRIQSTTLFWIIDRVKLKMKREKIISKIFSNHTINASK